MKRNNDVKFVGALIEHAIPGYDVDSGSGKIQFHIDISRNFDILHAWTFSKSSKPFQTAHALIS